MKCDDKSDEITAIPELLEILNISGCVLTIDAIGCQDKIVIKIVEKGGIIAWGERKSRSHNEILRPCENRETQIFPAP